MEELEFLRQWLTAWDGWGDMPLHIDDLGHQPENAGLYPLGEEVLERREDLLGGVKLRLRRRFALRRMTWAGEAAAGWLLELQQWVRQQSALGLAPAFGEDTVLRAEQGKCTEAATGTAVYTVTLTAEFTRTYL